MYELASAFERNWGVIQWSNIFQNRASPFWLLPLAFGLCMFVDISICLVAIGILVISFLLSLLAARSFY